MSSKNLVKIVFLAMVLTLAQACTSPSSSSKTKEEVKEAMGVTATDWMEVKNDYVAKSEARINDIATDVAKMEAQPLTISKKAKDKLGDKIEETKDMVSEIREDLQDLKKADADDWQSEQAEFQTALNKLEKNFDEVRSHYN